MKKQRESRVRAATRKVSAWLAACCVVMTTVSGVAQEADPKAGQSAESIATAPQKNTATASIESSRPRVPAAEAAYLAGAKKLDRNDLKGADQEFQRALKLDPDRREYVIALALTHEHELTELIQRAGKARLLGDAAGSDSLLAKAREIDPTNPMILEHSEAASALALTKAQAATAGSPEGLTDRGRMLAGKPREEWQRDVPVLEGPIELRPVTTEQSFHLRGDSQDVLTRVATAYGIRLVFDSSAEHKNLRFDMQSVRYGQAMPILMDMANVFVVPVDEKTLLVAKDDSAERDRLEPQLAETISVPGMTVEQINDLGNVIRSVFDLHHVSLQVNLESIVLRAPASVMGHVNRLVQQLLDPGGEVMLEAKLYEIDTTRMTNIGVTLPTQVGLYNVESAAASLVSQNQSLVQQAIAQGLIPATASNIEIALALIASGLVQSTLLSSTVGFFGHGLTLTGITSIGTIGGNLALNSSDTRTLDDVQMHVGDGQPATFRAGTRYPITQATYTTGLSTPGSALGNATINGVSVSSLLSQFAGGSSATIPQVQYEDLGVTLKTTPTIESSGRIALKLEMKIEALAGGSVNGIPVLGSREFVSTISVGDGETAMLVSSVNQTETAAVTGLPGLSELPGFQIPLNKSTEKDTGQLVVLITPRVIRRRLNITSGPTLVGHAQGGSSAN